jgi:hypothetical protein
MGGLSENLAAAKKQRLRWLIVAFVLAALLSWWYWPRGDARFVGKWEFWLPNATSPSWVVDLRSNGTGVVRTSSGPRVSAFPWRLENNKFLMGYRSKATRESLETLNQFIWKVSGRRWYPFYADALLRFKVIDANSDTIVLQSGLSQPTFRRVLE